LRIFRTENFTGAVESTYTHSSDVMPSSACSNTL